MDIRCRKTTCEFNNNHTCMAKEILIDGKIQCSSYKKACELTKNGDCKRENNGGKVGQVRSSDNKQEFINHKKNDTSKTMFEVPPKNAPFRSRKTIKIDCKANCLFNLDGVCKANGITVNDLGEPYCMGYLEK